jgi:hypothetical protein
MSKLKTLPIFTLILFFIMIPTLYAQIVKDDFRVNNDTIGGTNAEADVEILENGEEIIVWRDERNGNTNNYGQVYDNTGTPVSTNFKVSTFDGSYTEYTPSISSFGDSLLVIWQYRYGQWLLSDGSQEGQTFNLNSGILYSPDAAVSDSGFFVVWHYTFSTNGFEIFLKRFNHNGDSIGPRITINDAGTNNQRDARIAMNNDGYSVVVWRDDRNSSSYPDVYGQLLNPSGAKTGGNFRINDNPTGSSVQYHPSCAMDFEGNFIVVWTDYRDGSNTNIYGQRFDNSGNPLGGNFLITDAEENSTQYSPSCATDSAGNFVVVWQDYRDGYANVYGQIFDTSGVAQGANFRIDQNSGSANANNPRISMNENNFVVTWYITINSYTSIFKRRFDNDGTPVGDEVKVNDLDGTAGQLYPTIDMSISGNIVATWSDYRYPQGIYFQKLDTLGNKVGENVHIAYGHSPDLAVAEDSSFVITYEYSSDIYYQRIRPSGDTIGSPIIISDTDVGYRSISEVDIDSDKNAVAAWHDSRNGDDDIYAQMMDSAGAFVGINFKVNDDPGTEEQAYPDVAMSPSGKFLIIWYDYRNGNNDIYGRIYQPDGTPTGSDFRIDSGGVFEQYYPKAEYLPDGNFIVVWQDYRIPYGIYAQIIDSMGVHIDTNFRVSDHRGHAPSVSVAPTGEFVITWQDYSSNQYDIYAQKYNADYSPDSTNFKVNNEIEGINPNQDWPDVVTDGNNYIFAWQDSKWQKGWDIAAKVFKWEQGGVEENESASTMLLQNFPDPFLNSTTIFYQIGRKQDFSIKIYNLSGMLINTLVEGTAEPGIHSFNWKGKDKKGKDVPAGIYFCRLTTESTTHSIKMMLLR